MRVAVKVVNKKKFYLNKDLETGIEREIHMLNKLAEFDHEHIVHMFGSCQVRACWSSIACLFVVSPRTSRSLK